MEEPTSPAGRPTRTSYQHKRGQDSVTGNPPDTPGIRWERCIHLRSPAALLVGVQAPDEADELLRDELLGHHQLQLVEVGSLLLRQQRYRLQVSATGDAHTAQGMTSEHGGHHRLFAAPRRAKHARCTGAGRKLTSRVDLMSRQRNGGTFHAMKSFTGQVIKRLLHG